MRAGVKPVEPHFHRHSGASRSPDDVSDPRNVSAVAGCLDSGLRRNDGKQRRWPAMSNGKKAASARTACASSYQYHSHPYQTPLAKIAPQDRPQPPEPLRRQPRPHHARARVADRDDRAHAGHAVLAGCAGVSLSAVPHHARAAPQLRRGGDPPDHVLGHGDRRQPGAGQHHLQPLALAGDLCLCAGSHNMHAPCLRRYTRAGIRGFPSRMQGSNQQ